MAERGRDALEKLETLARATEDLRPAHGLTDAVMGAVDPADALERAARLTEELAPADDFAPAVMRVVGRQAAEPSWSDGVVRWARLALIGAAAAAAVSLVLSRHAERVFDSDILEGTASVEVDE
jgi:hypothetical protein